MQKKFYIPLWLLSALIALVITPIQVVLDLSMGLAFAMTQTSSAERIFFYVIVFGVSATVTLSQMIASYLSHDGSLIMPGIIASAIVNWIIVYLLFRLFKK